VRHSDTSPLGESPDSYPLSAAGAATTLDDRSTNSHDPMTYESATFRKWRQAGVQARA